MRKSPLVTYFQKLRFILFISLNSWFMTNWHAKCERGVIANHGKKRKERNIEKEKKEG